MKPKRPCLRCEEPINVNTYKRLCKRCTEFVQYATVGMMFDNVNVTHQKFKENTAPYVRAELLRALNKAEVN